MLSTQTVQAWDSLPVNDRIEALGNAYATLANRFDDCDDMESPCDQLGGKDCLVDGLTRIFHAHECGSDRPISGVSDPSEEGDSCDSFGPMVDTRRESRGEYHDIGSGNGERETVNDWFDQRKFVKAIMRDWSELLAD